MPNFLKFSCRGFSLLVPLVAAFAYAWWVGDAAGTGSPEETNARISVCVDSERAAERSGRACIGAVTDRCKADPDNAHIDDQMECDEREFTLWNLLLHDELAKLEIRLDPSQREKLAEAQAMWVAYQSADCRLPYVLFAQDRAVFDGPACTIELKASRALQLRGWRDALGKRQ